MVAAYRKCYSSYHVLIRLLENWKKELDNKIYFGAILMDLSKAFDSIPHELLIAKMNAYDFSENVLTFFFATWNDESKAFKLTTYTVFFNYFYLVFCKAQSSAGFSLIYS